MTHGSLRQEKGCVCHCCQRHWPDKPQHLELPQICRDKRGRCSTLTCFSHAEVPCLTSKKKERKKEKKSPQQDNNGKMINNRVKTKKKKKTEDDMRVIICSSFWFNINFCCRIYRDFLQINNNNLHDRLHLRHTHTHTHTNLKSYLTRVCLGRYPHTNDHEYQSESCWPRRLLCEMSAIL